MTKQFKNGKLTQTKKKALCQRIYNGRKAVSSAAGIGKVGQLHVNPGSYNTSSQHTQK